MTTPTGSPAERLLAAAAAARLPQGVVRAWNGPLPHPAVGQVWRARWDAHHQLVLLTSVTDATVYAAPVSLEVGHADDSTMLLSQDDTTLGVPTALWTSLTRALPVRVLDRFAGQISGTGQALLGGSSAANGDRAVTALDARVEYRALLDDTMSALASATWVPTGDGTLPAILGAAGLDPVQLIDALQVSPQRALQLLRGQAPLTAQQADQLVARTGRTAEELLAANPALPLDLIARLDRPPRRRQVLELARRRDVPEPVAWQQAAYEAYALAARQTGPGQVATWDDRIDRYFMAALDG